MKALSGKTVLVTGGTGSFGRNLTRACLGRGNVKKIVVFSRDELKQWEMRQEFPEEDRLRFFLGDVRDRSRLLRAFEGIDLVVHAAALKQVPATEYNPFEAVKTNILGAKNVIDAAIDKGVEKVIALSTDKACGPVNLYGATKLVSDKLFVDGNAYAGGKKTRFSVVRYGNVVGSRGSVLPLFQRLAATGELPITDERMTRFWITLDQASQFVMDRFERMRGGAIFVPKIPSIRITDLAHVVAPEAKLKVIGIRPGEKLHEELISVHDARRTLELDTHFLIQPDMEWWSEASSDEGEPVPEDFVYSSEHNSMWLDSIELKKIIQHA